MGKISLAVGEKGFIPHVASDIYVPTWKDLIQSMATVFSYGGKGVTTNRLKGSGTEPLNAMWGLNVTAATAAATDTALFGEAPESRVAGTSTQQTTAANVPNDTYQVVATITASSGRAIQEFGLFDTSTSGVQTTLSTTISATGTTAVTVASAAGFPGSGTYYVQALTEVMAVTGGQGTTTWTVTRGARGSTKLASISSGAIIMGGEATAGGNMFMKGDFSTINLNSSDSIQFTAKLQYT